MCMCMSGKTQGGSKLSPLSDLEDLHKQEVMSKAGLSTSRPSAEEVPQHTYSYPTKTGKLLSSKDKVVSV